MRLDNALWETATGKWLKRHLHVAIISPGDQLSTKQSDSPDPFRVKPCVRLVLKIWDKALVSYIYIRILWNLNLTLRARANNIKKKNKPLSVHVCVVGMYRGAFQ